MAKPKDTQLDIFEETRARDQALRRLTETRVDWIDYAFRVAVGLAKKNGRVTSTDVLDELKKDPQTSAELQKVDPRFMGPVFHRPCWRRVGWSNRASHGRPIPIWKYIGRERR